MNWFSTQNLLLILVILVAAMMGMMIYWVIQLNKLRAKSFERDLQRDTMFQEVAQIKKEATDEIAKIKSDFGSYGPPYATILKAASKSFSQVDQGCEKILLDRGRISAVEIDRISFLGAVIFIPIFREMGAHKQWWQYTQKFLEDFEKIPPKHEKAKALSKQLTNQGSLTRERGQRMLAEVENLRDDFETENRTEIPYEEERRQVEKVAERLGQLSFKYLNSADPPHQKVIEAYPQLDEVQSQIARLEKIIQQTKRERKKATQLIETLEQRIQAYNAKIKTEEARDARVDSIRAELPEITVELEKIKHEFSMGNYKGAIGLYNHLNKKITVKSKDLDQISMARQSLRTKYGATAQEVQTTNTWLANIPTRYEADNIQGFLSTARKQLSATNEILRSNDLGVLQTTELAGPQELVIARENFETNRQDFEQLFTKLVVQVSTLDQKIAAIIPNLTDRNNRYIQGINLSQLTTQNIDIQTNWERIASQSVIKESQIPGLIKTMQRIGKQHATLDRSCETALFAWQKIENDQQSATEFIQGETFRNTQDQVQKIVTYAPGTMAQSATQLLTQAGELLISITQKERFYATIERDAKSLLNEMQKLTGEYQRELAQQKQQYQILENALTELQHKLQEFQQHQLEDLRLTVMEPINDISTWKAMYIDIQKESLEAVRGLYRQGLPIQTSAQSTYSDVQDRFDEYQRIRIKSEAAIESASAALETGIQTLRDRPWVILPLERSRPEEDQDDDLANSRWFLRRANIDLEELDNLKRKITSQNAIEDLENKIYPTALKAKDEAQRKSKQLQNQIRQIENLRLELEKAMGDGRRLAQDVTDTLLHNEWVGLDRNYKNPENQIRATGDYESARAYLATALREINALILRMGTAAG
jgi:DNA repair exonuclease SbcCD ATPase subunit